MVARKEIISRRKAKKSATKTKSKGSDINPRLRTDDVEISWME